MQKKDFKHVLDVLNELSLYVYECMENEESATNKKALEKCFFNFKPFPPSDFEVRQLERLNDVPVGRPTESQNHRSGNDVAKQLNGKRKGIDEFFSKKELLSMPKLKDLSYRFRSDNIHEFRYRRNGISKSFSSADYKTAKAKAILFCKTLNENEVAFGNKKLIVFEYFAENYLQNVKRTNVTKKTFNVLYNRYVVHILPKFRNRYVADIKAPFIQSFLNGLLEKGIGRTAEDCYYLLKNIFQYASDNDIIAKNPVNVVKIPLHRREIGKALPENVERDFLKAITGHKYELNFLVLLYTGCRPCELNTLEFKKNGFVTFRNMKQHGDKIDYKDIPITPMLAPHVESIKKNLPLKQTTELAKIFSKICKNYKMYSLRHTFATRCQTCGVPQEVVGRWLGHKGMNLTDSVYTHFAPEYMLEIAKKVVY